MARRGTRIALVVCLFWVSCGLYASQFMYRGWIPHDEGTIGQSAERVLSGELPHRDFDDVYTGGLTYLHAAGMKVFGVNLRAPRIVLFGFFMAFLAAVFAIGRRVASPAAGLVSMALATVWSVPNYFVSLPSWYLLFFATFGVLALLRYLDRGHRFWIFGAGLCGGLSILAKSPGVFFLAGGVLFLMYVEQNEAIRDARTISRSRFFPIAAIPAGLCLAMLVVLFSSRAVDPGLFQLFVPALVACVFVAWREWAMCAGLVSQRVRRVLGLLWPLAAGAAIPVLGFAVFYWQHHALADLVRGVFVLPQRRLTEASADPPPITALGLAVPYAVLVFAGRRRLPYERLAAILLAGVLTMTLVLGYHPGVYRGVWAVARAMPMIAVLAACWMLAHRTVERDRAAMTSGARVFLVVAASAMTTLVQFPYATPTYFCYAAPMIILALVAVVAAQPYAPRRIHLSVAAFFLIFAVVFVNRSYGWNLGVQFLPYNPTSHLDLERGGLWVPDEDKQTYEKIAGLLRAHADGGAIYAGPDSPEVYFLAGFANPTRVIFDFLTPIPEDEQWMARLLAQAPIRAVVINTAPLFSPRLAPAVLTLLERRFPASTRVGRFDVRFADP